MTMNTDTSHTQTLRSTCTNTMEFLMNARHPQLANCRDKGKSQDLARQAGLR